MKKILFIVLIAFSANFVFAQQQDNSKMTKKEKRQAELQQQYEMTKGMIEDRNFVLESDFLQDRYGNRVFVNSTINFVMVNGDTAVIQIGSNHGLGPNGVGGVTAKGKITKWEIKENKKKKTFYLTMNMMSSIGIYDVSFSVGPTGQATAYLSGIRAGKLIFDGDLVQLEDSSVFEGQSI